MNPLSEELQYDEHDLALSNKREQEVNISSDISRTN
jgi:hypothetical protein